MTEIMLIRHGKNDTLGKTLTGRLPGVHLNEAGRTQAQRLAEALADFPVKAVYASPLERTLETAESIAGAHNLSVEVLPSLMEIDFGEWQGVDITTLKSQRLWKIVHENPEQMRFPGGEDFMEAQTRIVEGLLDLDKNYHKEDVVVCVSHGDAIRLAVTYFLGLPLANFHRIRISPASITVLFLQDGEVSFGAINYTFPFLDLSR